METLLNEAVILAGVLAPVVAIVVQLLKTADIKTKWLPFLSIALGIAIGVVFAIASGADLFVYGLAGFLAGAGASGLYDSIKSLKEE